MGKLDLAAVSATVRKVLGRHARSWVYATAVTFLLALTGLLGSVYSAEIKGAFPLAGPPYSGIAWEAVFFWTVLLITGLTFAVRQWSIDSARQKAEGELAQSADTLANLIRTMPPVGFLMRFGEIYEACEQAVWAASGQPSDRGTAIRAVLRGIAILAKEFDGGPSDVRYAANLMVYRAIDSLAQAELRAMRGRLQFESAVDYGKMQGVLDLETSLSATNESADADTKLQPLALAVLNNAQATLDHRSRWKVLPGAPIAFVSKIAFYQADTEDLVRWCQEHGDYEGTVIENISTYFANAGDTVRSFVAMRLTGTDGAAVGVLNLHRDTPNILRGRNESMDHFIAVVGPMQRLLVRLMEIGALEEAPHGGPSISAAPAVTTSDGPLVA